MATHHVPCGGWLLRRQAVFVETFRPPSAPHSRYLSPAHPTLRPSYAKVSMVYDDNLGKFTGTITTNGCPNTHFGICPLCEDGDTPPGGMRAPAVREGAERASHPSPVFDNSRVAL